MRTEISQAKREANFYIENVEKGKAFEAMETRKRKRNAEVLLSLSDRLQGNVKQCLFCTI